MSISIIVPLDVLGDAKDLTAEGIREALQPRWKAQEEVEEVARQKQFLENIIHAAGRNMGRIMDEIDDPFEKAKALRNLARELQEFKP